MFWKRLASGADGILHYDDISIVFTQALARADGKVSRSVVVLSGCLEAASEVEEISVAPAALSAFFASSICCEVSQWTERRAPPPLTGVVPVRVIAMS
jgi:hypothetical protein